MINIVSKSLYTYGNNGPKKVATSILRGFDLINYPHIVNACPGACRRVWIQDDSEYLDMILDEKTKPHLVVGPNISLSAKAIERKDEFVFLQPSQWTIDFCRKRRVNFQKMEPWAAGIDIEKFVVSDGKKDIVYIYWKQRKREDLEFVKNLLQENNIRYDIIEYGYYSEEEYKIKLSQAKYLIWLGRQESQGIALEEAMASNVPIIVCEPKNMGDWLAPQREMEIYSEEDNNYVPVTSAEYFDEGCGIKIHSLLELGSAISLMERDWQKFQPRKYIEMNLSLGVQARKMIAIFDKYYGPSDDIVKSCSPVWFFINSTKMILVYLRSFIGHYYKLFSGYNKLS